MSRIATYLINLCYRIGSTGAVKSGQLGGNEDTFMPIFPADTLGFAVAIQTKLGIEIHFVKNGPSPT